MKYASASLLGAALVLASGLAHAAPPTKDECVESHSRAQDEREQGQLADAKRLFLLCAQSSCPALIQSDCAKFGEELSRSVPSVSFSARDGRGNDLPDTQVYIDGQLVASRLDDGKAHDIDPGKRTIMFSHGGKETTLTVVIATGERGRNISAVIGAPETAATADTSAAKSPAGPSRSALPLVFTGIGGAALATGVVLTIVGLGKVPDACDRSSKQCTAAPGSPVFDDASSAMHLANIGIGVGIAGAVIGVGSLIWYFASSPKASSSTSAKIFRGLASTPTGAAFSF